MLEFLTKIGALLGKGASSAGHAIGKGAATAGKSIGQTIKKLPRPGAESAGGGMFRTPDFNPNAGGGLPRPGGSIPGPPALQSQGEPWDSPRSPLDTGPREAGVGYPLDSVDVKQYFKPAPSLRPPSPGNDPSQIAAPSTMRPGPDVARNEVPIPQLPGRKGGPSPWTRTGEAEYDYLRDKMTFDEDGKEQGYKRSWKNSLQNALLGAGRAAQANPEGGLGAMLGGALGGGLGATFNPGVGHEQIFNATQAPRIQAQQKQEQEQEDRELKRRDILAETTLRQAQTDRMNAEAEAAKRPVHRDAPFGTYDQATGEMKYVRPQNPTSTAMPYGSAPGIGLYDKRTGTVTHPAAEKPEKAMTAQDARDAVLAEDGDPSQIEDDTWNGRKDGLFSSMPQATRDILSGTRSDASAEEVIAAQKYWASIEQRERASIRRGIENAIKSKSAQKRQGGAKSLPRPSGERSAPRPVAVGMDAVNRYAQEKGISPEEARQRFANKGIRIQ